MNFLWRYPVETETPFKAETPFKTETPFLKWSRLRLDAVVLVCVSQDSLPFRFFLPPRLLQPRPWIPRLCLSGSDGLKGPGCPIYSRKEMFLIFNQKSLTHPSWVGAPSEPCRESNMGGCPVGILWPNLRMSSGSGPIWTQTKLLIPSEYLLNIEIAYGVHITGHVRLVMPKRVSESLIKVQRDNGFGWFR